MPEEPLVPEEPFGPEVPEEPLEPEVPEEPPIVKNLNETESLSEGAAEGPEILVVVI